MCWLRSSSVTSVARRSPRHRRTGRQGGQAQEGIHGSRRSTRLYTTRFRPRSARVAGRIKHPEVREAGELPARGRVQEEGARRDCRGAEAGGRKLFDALKERIFRDQMLKDRRRPDGRASSTRSATSTVEVGVLPRTHGSALFTRGETQALVTVTLGTKDDEQRIELLEPGEASKRFMLHYNFPPFSVGEVGFMRGPGRREIGHGALAERSLSP